MFKDSLLCQLLMFYNFLWRCLILHDDKYNIRNYCSIILVVVVVVISITNNRIIKKVEQLCG